MHPEHQREAARLARALRPEREEPPLRLRQGIVVGWGNGFLTLRPSGSDDPADDIPEVSYYSHLDPPNVGDVVECLANGSDWRAIGRVHRSSVGYTTRKIINTGSVLRGSQNWAEFDTRLDMAITARPGDWVLYGLSGAANNATFESYFDVVTLANGAFRNNLSGSSFGFGTTTGAGVIGWLADASNIDVPFGGTIAYQLKAEDVESRPEGDSQVYLRLVYRNSSAADRVFFCTGSAAMMAWCTTVTI